MNENFRVTHSLGRLLTAVFLALGYSECVSTPFALASDPVVVLKAKPFALRDVRLLSRYQRTVRAVPAELLKTGKSAAGKH